MYPTVSLRFTKAEVIFEGHRIVTCNRKCFLFSFISLSRSNKYSYGFKFNFLYFRFQESETAKEHGRVFKTPLDEKHEWDLCRKCGSGHVPFQAEKKKDT